MHEYKTDNIRSWLEESLRSLAFADQILLERRVKEECINHRLARFLELCYPSVFHDEFPANLDIDLEYNKNVNEGAKMLEIENGVLISIRPDIIVHHRLNNSSNILAVEAKLDYLRPGDRIKLSGLVKEPYNYLYSVGISYLPEKKYFRVMLCSRDNEAFLFDVDKI
ncbi:hypothetical protein SAMN05421827_102167 [Pedobacter terrae]|uniref:PD-(D/E)XK nuclease superfamily protein n=1 Tax=Pedobacter terrae TaxID=405671 RepID=A0A1G7Q4J7_9SPHI|nr:hypothetical protein [Pedobacter terrae]SDF93404.1 hypothetical protein SAMN05421827_102167 [Pedobacter terrae]